MLFQSAKLHSNTDTFRKLKRITLTAAASLSVFLFAACDNTPEESFEARDIANLRSAYAEAMENYAAGKQNTASREVEVNQKKAGWNEVLVTLQPELKDAAEKLSQLTGGKYTVEITVNEDNAKQAVLKQVTIEN